jgi:phosphoadenosine phosphosulfate reductase
MSDTSSMTNTGGLNRPQLWSIPKHEITSEVIEAKAQVLFDRLSEIAAEHQDVRFATSLAAEDMVVTDAIVKSGAKISLFTLATGRLHQETIDMTSQVQKHYGVSVASVAPEASDVEAFIAQYGLNGFYDTEEAKKACCGARKIKPLNKALLGADAWLTGQRREQAVTRSDLPLRELDDARNIAKYNPLFDWTESEVWAYLQTKQVPIHPLHFQGYPSIGCKPCTRAVKAGEDIRAGRWWWLQQDSKECGLHVK